MADIINHPGVHVDPKTVGEYQKAVLDRVEAEKEKYGVDDDSPKEDQGVDSRFIHECLLANELGDGMLYKAVNSEHLVFNKSMGEWLWWTGHHWSVDKMGRSHAAVERVVEAYLAEAAMLSHKMKDLDGDKAAEIKQKYYEHQRKEIFSRVQKLRGRTRKNNCIDWAHNCNDPLAIDGTDIDNKPYLLACKNGVVNLKTGELEPGRRSDHLMKSSPIEWQGLDSPCPLWEKTLLEIFDGNTELVSFLQRIFGYSLIGAVLQSIFVVMTGRGRNGKSLLVEVLADILGPLAGAIRSEMLLDQVRVASSAAPTPEIMALRGLRMAFASETDDGCRVSASRVKWLTGNDTLTGRNPHDKYEVQFKPSHTLFLLTNHVPQAPGDDFAFWERMFLIPFDLSFVHREPVNDRERRADPQRPEKLKEEYPGILAWMVRGCIMYQEVGLRPPAVVVHATNEYKQNEDPIGDFLDMCCEQGPDFREGSTEMFNAFEKWWPKFVSKKIPSHKWFGSHMARRFERVKKGTFHYVGVKLLDHVDDILGP